VCSPFCAVANASLPQNIGHRFKHNLIVLEVITSSLCRYDGSGQ